MGQITVDKNVGGIEGLCVIKPAVQEMTVATLWRPTMKKI